MRWRGGGDGDSGGASGSSNGDSERATEIEIIKTE